MSMKAAVDLLWVRPQKVGGIESYVRNLLDGFTLLNDDFELWLLVSLDNANTFEHYAADKRFHIYVCEVASSDVAKRIIWQNLYLGKTINKLGIKKCFEPYYCKPFLGVADIEFYTTIHDLQALHYPEYFSKGKVLWMKFSWWNTVKTSKKIFAISEYVKQDILSNYKTNSDRIVSIYNPITVNEEDILPFENLRKKYGIEDKKFYFTVSSLLPHKNLSVLLDLISKITKDSLDLPSKLIIAGVGGKSRTVLESQIVILGLEENVILTEFIDDCERNTLYKHCYVFLFPSIFEGFGMPPVEAMLFETPVITTRRTCLEEVTQGKANYVENPFDVTEWISAIQNASWKTIDFERYDKKVISRKYLIEMENGDEN